MKHPVIVGKIRYVPDHKSFGQYMMSETILEAALFFARLIIYRALFFAPTVSGQYRGSFFVKAAVETIRGNPRRSAIAGNDSDHAAQVEWGDRESRGRVQGGSHGIPSRPLGRDGAEYEPDWHGRKIS